MDNKRGSFAIWQIWYIWLLLQINNASCDWRLIDDYLPLGHICLQWFVSGQPAHKDPYHPQSIFLWYQTKGSLSLSYHYIDDRENWLGGNVLPTNQNLQKSDELCLFQKTYIHIYMENKQKSFLFHSTYNTASREKFGHAGPWLKHNINNNGVQPISKS